MYDNYDKRDEHLDKLAKKRSYFERRDQLLTEAAIRGRRVRAQRKEIEEIVRERLKPLLDEIASR